MEVQALGYLGISTDRLAEWEGFAAGLIGAQVDERTQSTLSLRLDDRARRLMVDTALAPGAHVYGWEVADSPALLSLAARLEAHGVAVTASPGALASQRGVAELIRFRDPAGNQLEAFHGQQRADTPFTPARTLSGFRTGSLGLGHAVLHVVDAAPLLAFYRDVMGFRLSDYMLSPFRAYFLHVNARHHSLALIETGTQGLHHLMLELLSLDDVGQAYDIALQDPQRIGVSLGRHTNDFMTSFYARTPSNFMIEYGWGGRAIDPPSWRAEEFFHGASLWGHERYWLTPEKRREALEMRLKAAADGFRAPVQVVEGHFVTTPHI